MDSHHHSHHDGSRSGMSGSSSHHSSHRHTHSSSSSSEHRHSSFGSYSGSDHHHHSSSDEYQGSANRHHTSSNVYGESEHCHHSHHGMHPHERALRSAGLSMWAGFLSVVVVVITYIVAHLSESSPNIWFNAAAATFAVAGLLLCFYAEVVQLRYWSSKVRKRMRIGASICSLALIVVGADTYQRMQRHNFAPVEYRDDGEEEGTNIVNSLHPLRPTPTDTSVFKPGWYGEAEKDGVTYVLVSFNENAAESRQFQRRLTTRISYAMLSVMNLGMKTAVVDTLTPLIHCENQQTHSALSAKELLLKKRMENEKLLEMLEIPKELKSGQMLSSVPVCMPPEFEWNQVQSAEFVLNGKPIKIKGRMYTADEKREMMNSSEAQSKTNAAPKSSGSPMNYYDNL